jgi:hypothetical protein
MNWEAIGAIGQLIGAVAVLATLIYVAVQVRYAKHQLEINGIYSRAENAISILLPIANDPKMASLVLEAGHPAFGDFGLEPVDAQRLGAWLHMWMQVEQANHHMLPKGTHDELLRFFLSIPAYAEFWDKNKNAYDKAFVDRMELIKAKVSPTGVDPDDLYARLD